MEDNKSRKLSLITEIILFLIIVFITVLVFTSLSDQVVNADSIASKLTNVDSTQYENRNFIKKIKEEFGINISYGSSTMSLAKKFDANIQENESIVNNNLQIIYESLSKYPKDAFYMCKSKKYPLNIVIFSDFNTDDIALAAKNSLNEFTIYLSNNEKLQRSINHEMYHVLEYYMQDTKKNLYSNWKDFNLQGVSYTGDVKNLNSDYVFDNNNVYNENTCFVTKYSKYSEAEDRAEIFAELMMAKEKPKFLSSKYILEKSKCIANAINSNITSEKFHFNQFLE